eukprot:354539-Pyramimonas_sp.AAC.1
MEGWPLLQHVARKENHALELDFGVERHRDAERTAATDQVREAQSRWVPDLGPIKWQQERDLYRAYREDFDDIWPWLASKG